MAFVVDRMKQAGKLSFVPLEPYVDVLALLNETVGGLAGSSGKKNMLPRIYRKWKGALPDLDTLMFGDDNPLVAEKSRKVK